MRLVAFGVLDPKRSDETIPLRFDWFPLVAQFWEPGVIYAANAYVRPTSPTGFAYRRVANGLSGGAEPSWPTEPGLTVVDGDGDWECVIAGSNGLTAIPSSPVVAVSPSGLTLGAPALFDYRGPNCGVAVQCSGGTDGVRYSVTCQITVGSEVIKGTLIVPVDNRV